MRARPRLDLVPACLDHDAETLIEGQPVPRDLLLKNKLSSVRTGYDYCVIDTPPSLRAPTLNALFRELPVNPRLLLRQVLRLMMKF